LLFAATHKIHQANSAAAGWRGMEMFVRNPVAPNDRHKQTIYRNFERNLSDIVGAGLASGAKIILSTVAVNLKDCPPFGSVTTSELPESNRRAYDKLCRDGTLAEAQGRFAEAEVAFQTAAEILPASAEAQFQ